MNASHRQLIRRCKYTSLLAGSVIVIASTARAQSARSQLSTVAAFAALHLGLQPAARCVEVFDYSAPRADTSATPAVSDSLDTADDSIDASAMLPGSGMVLVDAHGNVLATSDGHVHADSSARAACCTATSLFYSGADDALSDTLNQTVRSGSSARARCVDAMNPPPSKRSPL